MVIGGGDFSLTPGGDSISEDLSNLDVDLTPDIPSLSDLTPKLEDVGVKIVQAIENAYGYVREQVRGKEPDIIASITAGTLIILAGVTIYHNAKKGL